MAPTKSATKVGSWNDITSYSRGQQRGPDTADAFEFDGLAHGRLRVFKPKFAEDGTWRGTLYMDDPSFAIGGESAAEAQVDALKHLKDMLEANLKSVNKAILKSASKPKRKKR